MISLKSRRSVASTTSSTSVASRSLWTDGEEELGRFKVEYYGSVEIDDLEREEETLIDAILQVRG